MNSIVLLVVLIGLAYLGSAIAERRGMQGFSPSSGAVYIVLGVVLGPELSGLLERETLGSFEAVSRVGASWLALVAGLNFDGSLKRAPGRATLGVLTTTALGSVVALATWFALSYFSDLGWVERALLAVGAGLLYCTSAPLDEVHALWSPGQSPGPVARALLDVSRATPLVPAIALAVLSSFAPEHGPAGLSEPARVAVTLGVGLVLGILASLLLGREFRHNESWGLLLGLSLLGSGAAIRVGLSAVAVTFTLGLTISILSRHGRDIREMIAPTHRAVLLPVALLAGAAIDPAGFPLLLAGGLLLIRLSCDLLIGNLVRLLVPATRPAGPWVGMSLSLPGALTLAAGVELGGSLPASIAPSLLVMAIVSVVVGEVLSSLQLRRSLLRAGEVQAPEPEEPAAS